MDTDCLKIPGYDFWIETDGRRAKQYKKEETHEPGGNVVSCYIASEVGKEFRIGIRKHENSQLASCKSYLNDDFVDSFVYRTPCDTFVSHIYTASGETRRFAFSAINFEEDELAELTSIPLNLGCIRVEVFRVAKINRTYSAPPKPYMLNTPTLSEKSKAISLHTTALLKPEKTGVESLSYSDVDYIDSRRSPWYTIKFFYRPLDTLQAEGIAPAPAPIPAPNGERSLKRGDRRSSDSTGDRKPLIKAVHKVDGSKAASREEPIVIEDSDEDSNYSRNKRHRESLGPQPQRKKQKGPDPVVIILDSD